MDSSSDNRAAGINQSGVSAIIIVMLMLIMSALGLAIISMTNFSSLIAINQLSAAQAFYIAEAGIERAVGAIREDTSTTQTIDDTAAGYCVTPCLDAYVAPTGTGLTNPTRALFYGTSLTSTTFYYCTLAATVNYNLVVYDFQQRYNLSGTPIKAMEIGIRATKASGGTNSVIQLGYSLNGGGSWTNAGSTVTISSTSTTTPDFVFRTIAVTPSWSDLMAGSGANFRIRALLTSGNRATNIDYLCIRVTLKADVVTEPWYTTFKDSTGNPLTVNIPMGTGAVVSAPIDDEQGKVHLNYAAQSLLSSLMVACGVASATASTLATNIVTYRGSNWFDTVEELQNVSGMTSTIYNQVRNYVTVYSWVNPNVQRTTGSRAPININTAPLQVLQAVFDPIAAIGATDHTTLANAIIARRATVPFSSMVSSNPADTADFHRFIETQTSYLTTTTERNAVKENCDASYYNVTQTTSWASANVTTTEFCYSSNVYSVTSTGKVQNAYRETRRVFEDDGTFNITSGALTLNYWKELVP